MPAGNIENEVKFLVKDLNKVEQRLQAMKARRMRPRLLEVNLLFDTPQGSLQSKNRLLRLRSGDDIRLTYKSQAEVIQGVSSREEIEFRLEDFDLARSLLERLGYQVVLTYERYRTTYTLGEAHILLDEMPFGSFVEIEAPTPGKIRRAAEKLQLNWARRITVSYAALFERLCSKQELDDSQLTFQSLAGIQPDFKALGLTAAD